MSGSKTRFRLRWDDIGACVFTVAAVVALALNALHHL